MNATAHPSEYIDTQLVQLLRNHSAEAELLKQLHPAQLLLIHQQKWFRLFVPEHKGGLEYSLPEALRLEESLAWTDGSVGWTVTLCAGAGWFIGFLDPEIAAIVFSDPAVCLAGSGKASGIAKKVTNGYEVSGYWLYATGAAHATVFTANCMIEENGVLLKEQDGSPVIRPFLFMKDEVTVHQTWNSIGMKATGSFGFEVREIAVPPNRVFRISSEEAHLPHPIYQYPFMPFAESTLAVNSSGMATRFLDLCSQLLTDKPGSTALYLLEKAVKQLEACRSRFYEIVEQSWKYNLDKKTLPPALITSIGDSSRELAATARRSVDELYPYCGMYAADPATEINRVWRNLHTASQHNLLNR